jgi:hypothetical protein
MVARLLPVPAVEICGVARVNTSVKPRLVGPDAGVPKSCNVRNPKPAFRLCLPRNLNIVELKLRE